MEESFLSLFKEFGFPSLITGAIMFGIWKAFVWLGKEIAQPLARSHMSLVEQLAKSDQLQSEVLSRIEESQNASSIRQSEILSRMERTQSQSYELLQRNHSEIISTQKDIVVLIKQQQEYQHGSGRA